MFPYIMLSTVMALTSLLPWESLCSTSHLGFKGEGGCDVDEVDVDDVDKVVVADVDDACDVDEVDVYHLADWGSSSAF